ncbi:MAG: hypothetical protein ACRD96_23155 [Bryobacteraceae bacterium]
MIPETRRAKPDPPSDLAGLLEDAPSAALARRSDELNQALRRLRQTSTTDEVSRWLLDATAPYCARRAVLSVHGADVEGVALGGVEAGHLRAMFDLLDLALPDAPALAQCAETGEPVIAAASRDQVSSQLADVFDHQDGEKAYLFPIVVRSETAAILYAAPGEAPLDVSLLELLAGIAATAVEAQTPAAATPRGDLVQIAGINAARTAPDWSRLETVEQALHVKAQRFARVHVAEMRLYHAEAVERGRARQNLYGALRSEIDAARETFRRKFVQESASMADYLHMELVRTLAQDNPALMGRQYPGPLA